MWKLRAFSGVLDTHIDIPTKYTPPLVDNESGGTSYRGCGIALREGRKGNDVDEEVGGWTGNRCCDRIEERSEGKKKRVNGWEVAAAREESGGRRRD